VWCFVGDICVGVCRKDYGVIRGKEGMMIRKVGKGVLRRMS
jgi:hypothetical protein